MIYVKRNENIETIEMAAIRKEETVQAVLINDSYDIKLQPFTDDASSVGHYESKYSYYLFNNFI